MDQYTEYRKMYGMSKQKIHKILVQKHWEEARLWGRRLDGKMSDENGCQNIECGEVDWIQLAQNKVQRGILRTY